MERIYEYLLIILPASLVLFGMYITVLSFINGQKESINLNTKAELAKTTLPLQLQAYERICLLLERITPQNIIIRLNSKSLTVADFQQVLISEIREEFNHNISQQLYMSDHAWSQVKNAVEQTIGTINEAAAGLEPTAIGLELSKKILNTIINNNQNTCEMALQNIKAEARNTLF